MVELANEYRDLLTREEEEARSVAKERRRTCARRGPRHPAARARFTVYFLISIAGLAWEAKANGVLVGSLLSCWSACSSVRLRLRLARGRGDLGFAPLLRAARGPAEAARHDGDHHRVRRDGAAGWAWARRSSSRSPRRSRVMGVRGRRHIVLVARSSRRSRARVLFIARARHGTAARARSRS